MQVDNPPFFAPAPGPHNRPIRHHPPGPPVGHGPARAGGAAVGAAIRHSWMLRGGTIDLPAPTSVTYVLGRQVRECDPPRPRRESPGDPVRPLAPPPGR